MVYKPIPNKITFRVQPANPKGGAGAFEITAYHLNFTRGMIVGRGNASASELGLLLVRS